MNLKIALLLFPQSTHETRAIKFCDRMLLHIATNSVIPGSHIRNLQNMPIWYYATEIREVLSLHGFFLLKTRVFVGYSIYIFEIPIGLLIVLCKWYVDIINHLVVKLVATLAKLWWVTSTCFEQSLLSCNFNSMQLCLSAPPPPSIRGLGLNYTY